MYKEAGFKDIKIIGEANYPIEAMANDATARALIKNFSTKEVDLKDMENSVVSIKIYAVK